MIRENVESGNTSEALKKLIEFIDTIWSYKDELLSQRARIKDLEAGSDLGTVGAGDALIQENQLRWSTLQNCSDIEEELLRFFPEIKQKVKVSVEPFENQVILKLREKYDSIKKLFEGNSAIFFKGYEKNSTREVVLRVFKTHDFSYETDKVTQENLNTLLRLKHRNIIKVTSTELGGFPQYLVLEYINGTSLDHLIGYIPFTLHDSIELLEQLADALYYLHINGVAHKTVKPDKILIDRELKPVISPYEIFSSDKLSYSNLDLVESLLYSDPEVLKGNIDEPNDKSDQFALAAVAYEVLSGRPLFAQKSGDKNNLNVHDIFAERVRFFRVKKDRKEILSRLNLPKQYEAILDRMLSESPEDRFPSMYSVIQIIQSIKLELDEDMQIALSSFRRCVVRNPEFTVDFYQRLLQDPSDDDPLRNIKKTIIAFFDGAEKDEDRERKRQKMLRVAVNLLLMSRNEGHKLKKIADMPVHVGATAELYRHFIDVLIDTIKENDYLWVRYNDLCNRDASYTDNPIDDAWDNIRASSHAVFKDDQSPPNIPGK